jgi:CRISPR system Cascade subunit CasC
MIMSTFIQLHLLTSYPPSNLNRDDLGRPKTAVMGGRTRLRVSSQSLKRAWRTSDFFEKTLKAHVGTRTRRIGKEWILTELPTDNPRSEVWANDILAVYGDPDNEPGVLKQLVFVSPTEQIVLKGFLTDVKNSLERDSGDAGIQQIVALHAKRDEKTTSDEKKKITKQIIKKLRPLLLKSRATSAADIAMFGRMLASAPAYNMEAAVQVAHAITVHEVAVEDDYFTAVDDLNKGEEDLGAAHIGETEFAAGVFYLYICINRDLLEEKLGGDCDLAQKSLAALVEAAAKVSPTGKQNSFASRARTSYLLAEKGSDQPRSLSVAFLKPVRGEDVLALAIKELEKRRDNFDKVYGPCADDKRIMNAETGEGSLNDIIAFVKE